MSEAYAREVLRRNVAQICQTIGWNGINSTPLDILVHVLEKYIRTLGTQANNFAEQFNRTEPNLDDLGLVFRDLHVQLPELLDYSRSVPPIPPPVTVERFPKPKESNLNFLKPGSHEVVTRPMHVHEHLPPMYPEKERETPVVADTVEIRQNGIDTAAPSTTCTSPEISVTDSPEKSKDPFKRPSDPISLPTSKRPRLRLEEEERTREISSVMMTMSGFLSPAREGKLPEAKAPTIVSDRHHDKHKANSHHSNLMKVPLHPSIDKIDKKSRKSKLLNGKIMKSKRKDKSHKGESSKSKDSSKSDKYPPGHPSKSRDIHPTNHNHNITMPAPKLLQPPKPVPPLVPVQEIIKPVIKQEPMDYPPPPPVVNKHTVTAEDAIPVPRKIPISKSPLVSNVPLHRNQTAGNSLIPDIEIKKEVIDEEVKLASQPDRSKINIFKKISNKSKEDKASSDASLDKSPNTSSRLHNSTTIESTSENRHDNFTTKSEDSFVNNNDDSALDLSKEMDLTTNEVISIDDDSFDMSPEPRALVHPKQSHIPPLPGSLTIKKSLQLPYPKDIAGVSPKIKKEKKHREKKDKAAEKAAKLEAKLLKQQQKQLALEMAQAQKPGLKMAKSPKLSKPKNDKSKPLPPGFPFFHNMAPGRGLMPGPGLIPGGDFLAGLANNPALRGLAPPNLLANPFALGASGPGLIPGPSFLPGMPNPLMSMGNFGQSSRSSSSKIPPMLRRPSLEVIPVDNDEDRGTHKSPGARDRLDKHKSPTIPNILQKHKSKSHKEHKSNMYKMPPVQPDITIELNPPREPEPPPPPRAPSPPPAPAPLRQPTPTMEEDLPPEKTDDNLDKSEKKKDKAHKKEKKDKDGLKIKKKKDKKDKNKDKSEKKKDKDDKSELKELKDRIKKEKKEKKKDKIADGLVPKLTLKLGSASPMPPSSPDIFKLNIKPIVKKEEEDEDSPAPVDDPVSRENSRSPELAQFAPLVTRPPKQKHSKHNHTAEQEPKSPPPSGSSPTRKNRPPSSNKYKRILCKTLAKKGQAFDDDMEMAEDVEGVPTPMPVPVPAVATDKPLGPLPTPYYVDDQGNKIWVCPACGRPDNGSPMIGCDGCDGWYHWVCVGITEEPGATEDWFCKSCTAKRAAMVLAEVTPGKKRGRKPKGEKVRDCN
ncbi:hypothetical protein JYU34_004940 [Plutella xylostella]|uniref:PHD-type domain-containing protein n=1 Tax=Plutella xylostella TaxID=51655 RepID=A0ABQ7QVH7_PLUXY|nr:hypothetical protein JYU34_004940 [Plutella xylostella]